MTIVSISSFCGWNFIFTLHRCKFQQTHPNFVAFLKLVKLRWPSGAYEEYFSEGAKCFSWFFPGMKCFFPVEDSYFGRHKTNFSSFQNSIFNFQPSFSRFSFFSAPFSLFSLPLFSRYVSRNFPVRSLWGGTLPPPFQPCSLCRWWPYCLGEKFRFLLKLDMSDPSLRHPLCTYKTQCRISRT